MPYMYVPAGIAEGAAFFLKNEKNRPPPSRPVARDKRGKIKKWQREESKHMPFERARERRGNIIKMVDRGEAKLEIRQL